MKWKPQLLWNGQPNVFRGLRDILEHAEASKVYIVAAQCYGSFFADKLEKVYKSNPPTRVYELKIEGLSYEKTQRVRCIDTSISCIVKHRQLASWIQRKFTFSADELEDAYDGTSTDNSE